MNAEFITYFCFAMFSLVCYYELYGVFVWFKCITIEMLEFIEAVRAIVDVIFSDICFSSFLSFSSPLVISLKDIFFRTLSFNHSEYFVAYFGILCFNIYFLQLEIELQKDLICDIVVSWLDTHSIFHSSVLQT